MSAETKVGDGGFMVVSGLGIPFIDREVFEQNEPFTIKQLIAN